MTEKFPFIINEFTEKRGEPCLVHVNCQKCDQQLFIYQKDGPGPLKRCYIDRVHDSSIDLSKPQHPVIKCPNCARKLGCLEIYEKENRPAIYWFVESVVSQACK